MVTVYHEGATLIKKLDIKYMLTKDSNAQEGIGIYFGDLETAEGYGKNIVSTTIDKNKFWDSREDISKYSSTKKILDLFKILNKLDNEPLYNMITDWGIEIQEPRDVTQIDLLQLAKNMQGEEVRNFQITLAQEFGVVNFVKAWNKVFPNNLGTYNKELDFYAIINTKVTVQKYKI